MLSSLWPANSGAPSEGAVIGQSDKGFQGDDADERRVYVKQEIIVSD